MYKIFYNDKGIPQSVRRTNDNGSISSIPFNTLNIDFQKFLEWNAKQTLPLDYKSKINVQKSEAEIQNDNAKEQVKALKEKLVSGQKLTDKERADVIDSLIQLLG